MNAALIFSLAVMLSTLTAGAHHRTFTPLLPNQQRSDVAVRKDTFGQLLDHRQPEKKTFSEVRRFEENAAQVLGNRHDGAKVATGSLWDFGTSADTRYPNESGIIHDNFGSTALRSVTPPAATLDQYHLYQVITTTNDWKCLINGTNYATLSPNTVNFQTAPKIGKGSSKYFSGNIAEILIFTNVLTSAQDTTVRNYLKNKYNLP